MTHDGWLADFPLRYAATGRFNRGAPRNVRALNRNAVLFIRSPHGRSSRGDLWLLDVSSGRETLLVDASSSTGDDAGLPAAERARRERLREGGAGLTAYDTSPDGSAVVFALGGRLHLLELDLARVTTHGTAPSLDTPGRVRVLDVPGPVVDPRAGATGVAWNRERSVWVCNYDGTEARQVTPDDEATWGLADFIAAEELGRMRGFWWSPDGRTLLVARVDDAAVPTWWISDPAAPEVAPSPHKYPAAGSTNASVSLWLIDLSNEDAQSAPVQVLAVGPGEEFEYLAAVTWRRGEALAQVFTRDQRRSVVLAINPAASRPSAVAEWTDDAWVDVVPGTPTSLADGRILTVRNDPEAGTLRLFADDTPISPADVLVRSVVGVMADDGVILRVAATPESSDIALLDSHGTMRTLLGGGWFNATWSHELLTSTGAALSDVAWCTQVHRVDEDGAAPLVTVESRAESAGLAARPRLDQLGDVRFALLLPSWIDADGSPPHGALPLLLLPYGGPHAQRVMAAGPAYIEARWWAERGYAVLITDGAGTPGVSPAWERAIRGDFATRVLADQVKALDEVLARFASLLDGERVGIMGWSFGGYLAALAVLDRPDRFHVAVAGAPVTDWRLYDTGYTERYLGDPHTHPQHYDVSDLISRAADLTRPLLLIHGMADDNVVAAHTLRLSGALLAAGRPHSVLPLTNVTHMTPQPVIAANLLRAQASFLDGHLHPKGLPDRSASAS